MVGNSNLIDYAKFVIMVQGCTLQGKKANPYLKRALEKLVSSVNHCIGGLEERIKHSI